MYFGVAKFIFEHEEVTTSDKKELYALVDKIRSKFKVCVKPTTRTGEPSLVVAALSSSEGELNRELDAIAEFCENSGFGRIESEISMTDHIDAYMDKD